MDIPQEVVEQLNALPIEEVASKLGIVVNRHKSNCFMHNDKHPSLSFTIKKNLFYCFVCGKGGGPIRLVQEHEGLSFQNACVWLGSQFNIWIPEKKAYRKPVKKTIKNFFLPKNDEEEYLFDREVFLWLINKAKLSETAGKFLLEERHLKREVVERLSIKSVSDSKKALSALVKEFGEERCLKTGLIRRGEYGLYFYFYTPCLLFPYYEQDGRLVGIQSRYLGENNKAPRFQFLSSQKTRVFNLSILNTLKRGDRLYISEGITDCLAMLSAGLNAVAIPSATILPIEDLVMLKHYDLHMYPDQDDAGQKAFLELRRFFVNQYSTLKAEKLPEGAKDYSDYYIIRQEANGKE